MQMIIVRPFGFLPDSAEFLAKKPGFSIFDRQSKSGRTNGEEQMRDLIEIKYVHNTNNSPTCTYEHLQLRN
jgi:hypothetical protein